jgi:hypothetical protein
MIAWKERPVEVANLLNPAFCSLLLRDAIAAYAKANGTGMDFPLAFLVLPIVLHKATREALPRTTISKFHIWFQEHQALRIGFSTRTKRLIPFTREALLFAMQRGALALDDQGLLVAPKFRFQKVAPEFVSHEMAYCRDRADFLGKWIGAAGSASYIFNAWGITLR